jgi:hypothetical protein
MTIETLMDSAGPASAADGRLVCSTVLRETSLVRLVDSNRKNA